MNEKPRENFNVSLAQEYALDAAKHINSAMWWNTPLHLERALVAAQRCVKTLRVARKECKRKAK